jgi:hypothetical protein
MPDPTIEERLNAVLSPEPDNSVVSTQEPPAEEAPQEQNVAQPETPQEQEQVEEQPQEQPQEQTESVSEDVVEVETLSGLAEHLGVEAGDLYALKIPATAPDGSKMEITLGDYKDAYVSSEQNKSKQKELDDKKQALEKQHQELEQNLVSELQKAQSVVQLAEGQLLHEYQSVNWQELRDKNPGEFAAKQADFSNRQRALEEAKQAVIQSANQGLVDRQRKFNDEFAALMTREGEALIEAIPEWRKDDVHKAEKQKVTDYLVGQGFDESQINGQIDDQGNIVQAGITDHRLIVIARKAMLYDQTMKQVQVDKKRVVKIGSKVLKPGAKQPKNQAKQDQYTAARNKLRKSGKPQDAAEAIARIIDV